MYNQNKIKKRGGNTKSKAGGEGGGEVMMSFSMPHFSQKQMVGSVTKFFLGFRSVTKFVFGLQKCNLKKYRDSGAIVAVS